MARVLKGSHNFTCTPRVHPLIEFTIPAFAFPTEAGTYLPIPEGWKAELAFGDNSSFWSYLWLSFLIVYILWYKNNNNGDSNKDYSSHGPTQNIYLAGACRCDDRYAVIGEVNG